MRKVYLRALLLGLVAIVLMVLSARDAAAQNACCLYRVSVGGVPANCFPFTVTSSWGGVTQNNSVAGNGPPFNVFNIPNCPPIPAFDWISLDGGTTHIGIGVTETTLPCGICVAVNVTYDGGSCIKVNIVPC